MNDSIFTFVNENRNVLAWLGNKRLAKELENAGTAIQQRISSESADVPAIDKDLVGYGDELLLIQDDLTKVRGLRAEESRLRAEIDAAQEKLEQAKKKRKNLIMIAVVAAIVVAIGIGVALLGHSSEKVETEVIENVEE